MIRELGHRTPKRLRVKACGAVGTGGGGKQREFLSKQGVYFIFVCSIAVTFSTRIILLLGRFVAITPGTSNFIFPVSDLTVNDAKALG